MRAARRNEVFSGRAGRACRDLAWRCRGRLAGQPGVRARQLAFAVAAEGEEVEGWQLTRIGAEEVELTRGEQLVRLPARLRAAEGVLRY